MRRIVGAVALVLVLAGCGDSQADKDEVACAAYSDAWDQLNRAVAAKDAAAKTAAQKAVSEMYRDQRAKLGESGFGPSFRMAGEAWEKALADNSDENVKLLMLAANGLVNDCRVREYRTPAP